MNGEQKFICIHGHFYQPPRENAWLEVVESQDSAAPFHDWNERINFECYALNARARILDKQEYIINILNNYAKISFNLGPTLLSWMEAADPGTYKAILQADKNSMQQFGGHGSAIAQVHSHLILPLANERDKQSQVIWGIKDFEYRFGRKPEGMWLAETAANIDTLEVLAEHGITYTILAPRQAKAIRKIGEEDWTTLPHDSVDPRRPYLCKLPSGKEITLFFYHGGVAQGVAFEGLLNNGKHFAQRLIGAFDDNHEPQLVHIATDGESYGHHHRKGEMALADCLNYIEKREKVKLTNYGEYLEHFPPTYEVQIFDNSSWSCVHGVERWRSNCGCNTGGNSGWNQEWRGPLRETLNWLRDQLIPIYEKEAALLINDVWEARNDYIEVLLCRNKTSIDAFLERHKKRELTENEIIQLLRLMEMQRQSMLMFTSCGWFFDEISGIETKQILQYANRAIHYAKQVSNRDLHPEFIALLEKAPSNVHANGAVSYKNEVIPKKVNLVRVGMHYAASSLFEEYPERLEIFNYIAESERFVRLEAGTQRLSIGRTSVQSKITLSKKDFSFAALYLGQHNIIGNISLDMEAAAFDQMTKKIVNAFNMPDLGQVIGLMQEYFGPEKYTIWHLFKDEKRKILQEITQKSIKLVESTFREIYNDNYQLMTGVLQSDIPVPHAYLNAVQYVVNQDLDYYINESNLSIREIKRLVSEFRKWKIVLNDEKSFKLSASERVYKEVSLINSTEVTLKQLQRIITILVMLEKMGISLDFWKSQNMYFSILQRFKKKERTFPGEEWENAFYRLGKKLRMRI
ncbi:MAG: glycoside hydrolase [Saprospiraceae bacterium]|nr:MAG: glycoside hydrolase [Saprospiraceae bacterium]